jgi:hypothetical protein
VSFVDSIVKDLERKETKRLTPIVKSDILTNLQASLAVDVKKKVRERAQKYVDEQSKNVLKILHAALVQKNKVDLLPAMNAKLSTTVPRELNSAKFQAQVQAAQLELKTTLKAKMKRELSEPLEKVAKLQINEQEKEKSDAIRLQIQLVEDNKLKTKITEETKHSDVAPRVEEREQLKLKQKIQTAVNKKVKKEVDRDLGFKLKLAIHNKYYKGTMKDSMKYIRDNEMDELVAEVTVLMKKKADRTAAAKGVSAKEALYHNLKKDLTDTIYAKLAAEGADQLQVDTEGMSVSDRKAVELQHQQRWKLTAATKAEKQAMVEVSGASGEEVEQRLKQQEEKKISSAVSAEVAKRIKKKAEILTRETLKHLYNDDLKAMEQGHNHVSQREGQPVQPGDTEQFGPDVARTALEMIGNTTKTTDQSENKDVKNMATALAAAQNAQAPVGKKNATDVVNNDSTLVLLLD